MSSPSSSRLLALCSVCIEGVGLEKGGQLISSLSCMSSPDPTDHVDDEYSRAGVYDPKILLTTSRDPSSKLLQFSKVSHPRLSLRYIRRWRKQDA